MPSSLHMCSKTNLYGEWMMVQPRRRGFSNSYHKITAGRDVVVDADGRGGSAVASGSMRNMQSYIERNPSDVYLALNPDKKKKKVSTKQLGPVEVIPTVDGTESIVVTHRSVVRSGTHATVRIIEKIKDGVTLRHRDGVARKGLCVKKPMNSGKGGLGVVEWVKSTHARIYAIGKQSNRDFGSNSTAMDESYNDHQLFDDEELWEEDQLDHMSDVGDEVYDDVPQTLKSANVSRLWKGLSMVWEDIRNNIVWRVGSGENVNFWHDCWITNLGPLFHHLFSSMLPICDDIQVEAMVVDTGEWKL
ncbi:hypothetical protein V6N13_019647 [Hibiscus sabdariffa]